MPAGPAPRTTRVDSRVARREELLPLGERWLSAEERSRADASGARAADFVAGAVLLRLLVAERIGQRPDAVRVERRCPRCGAGHGRPALPGTGLIASVTHAGGLVAAAVSDGEWLGLDLEPRGRDLPESAARRVLTEAEVALAHQPGDLLRLWTAKEAALKAAGTGLAGGLVRESVVLSLDPLRAGDTTLFGTPGGRLLSLPLPGTHVGALAVDAGATWT